MRKHQSFTLIEMLVVIFIIIVLAAVTFFGIGQMRTKQRDNTRKSDINTLAGAIEEFKADHGHYPFINWGPGLHAFELPGAMSVSLTPQEINYCRGAEYDVHYTAGVDIQYHDYFYPGAEIRFIRDNLPCDDLSLQLLGKAYLKKMPNDDPLTGPTPPNWYEEGVGAATTGYDPPAGEEATLWLTSGLKSYLDEIPKEPDPNIDLEADDGTVWNPFYFYNSYYDCACEGIYYGGTYWIQAMLELEADSNGEGRGNEEGLFFYELGNMNWNRDPQTVCGC